MHRMLRVFSQHTILIFGAKSPERCFAQRERERERGRERRRREGAKREERERDEREKDIRGKELNLFVTAWARNRLDPEEIENISHPAVFETGLKEAPKTGRNIAFDLCEGLENFLPVMDRKRIAHQMGLNVCHRCMCKQTPVARSKASVTRAVEPWQCCR